MKNAAKSKSFFKLASRALTLLLLVAAASVYYAGSKRSALPPETELLEAVEDAPQQKNIQDRAFKFNWRNLEYAVYPVAEYTVTGLVVTRNDISGFSDIYHTSDSVDVVDLCLIWGTNTREDVYRNLEFWSEPFSCWYRPKNEIGANEFNGSELSNTHIVPKDEALAKRLNGIRLGDQVRLHGRLINYHPAGASEQLRKSSLVRTDTGNGACEVMFVENLEMLRRGNPGWNDFFDGAKIALWISAAAKLISLLLFPYLEFRTNGG